MSIHSNPARHGKGLGLLSFDAGGPRSVSQLKILAEMLHRWNFEVEDDKKEQPCTIFDMIGGVGSGGFVSILLVSFGLTAEEALEEFIELSVAVLDKPGVDAQSRTTALKEYVELLLDKYGIDKNTRLLDPNDRTGGCKLVIPLSHKRHAGSVCILRNYPVRHEQTVNLTIAEALLATISTPPLFTSISIFKDAATFEYTGADWTLSNPTQEIIAEAHATFGRDERVACLLNLGSGHPGIVSFPEGTGLLEWNRFLEALATDGQRMAECLESQMGNLGLYYRFSITSGLERSAVLEPGDILTHTSAYLAKTSVSRKMDICVDSLKVRDGVISLGQLKHPGSQTIQSPQLPPLTRTFVMREGPWAFIKNTLLGPRNSQDLNEPRMLVVTGMGGCGKSQLMLKFMKEHESKFPHQFFIDGSSEDRIRADIIRNVRTLGVEYSQKAFEDCLLCLSQPSRNGQYLLLYDNVDDPSIDLSSLLPRGPSCAIVITSRNGIIGELHPEAHLQLDMMSADEAIELLLYSPNGSVEVTDQARRDALAIAQVLGCLPIALQQAHSYMQQTKCSAVTYLKSLSSNRQRLLGQLTQYQLDVASISTYAAFEMSYKKLPTHVQQFLRLVSYFHWTDFPLELVVLAAEHKFSDYERSIRPVDHDEDFYAAKGILDDIFFCEGKWDITILDEFVVQLQSYSLVTVSPGVGTRLLQMHPLMHEWVRSSIPHDEAPGSRSAAVTLLALGSRWDYTISMRYLSSHVTHMTYLWDRLHINNVAAFGLILYKNKIFRSALELQERVVKTLREQLDAGSAGMPDSMELLAFTYRSLGQLKETEVLQEEVLKLRMEILGERHPDTIDASSNLARTYRDSGRPNEAQVLQEEVLKLRKEIFGERHTHTIIASSNLASTYYDLGRLDDARVLQEEVVNLSKDILGERHPDTITSSGNLALTYRTLGRLDDARALEEEVVKRRREILGEQHPKTILASSNLAITYYALGRLDDAQLLEEEVVKLMKEVFGEQYPDTIEAVFNLAEIYISRNRKNAALDLLNKTEGIIAETLGLAHPQYIRCQGYLSRLHKKPWYIQLLS